MDKKWIYYELLKIKYQKIPQINTSEEIFKLTNQMKSKCWNWYVNGNLRTRGIYGDKNDQILICKLKVIDPESQCLTSDERWIVLGQTSNWRVKWNSEFDEFSIYGKLMKREIQWNQNQVIWNYNQRDILFSRSKIFRMKFWGKGRILRTNLQN